MTGLNRGRITVNLGGAWRLYTNNAPVGCRMLGTVTHGPGTGALALTGTGIYVQVNEGCLMSLDQRKVIAALAEAKLT